ncbi:MAG: dephospho-CoA kinase [Albidovulum sp.]|nr:dephospho-CoA kinase [Albidovulum sp.]
MTNETLVLGLTGSVGMGKSTTARMFKDEGIPVWDADQVVAKAYSPGGAAVDKIKEVCPTAVPEPNLGVDRNALRACLDKDQNLLERLERVVHPIVADDRRNFLADARARNERIVVLDVPLLYEVGAEGSVDAVVVVTVSGDVQRQRVLARENMTEERFTRILSRQVPDQEKLSRADYVIETSSEKSARAAVKALIEKVSQRNACR